MRSSTTCFHSSPLTSNSNIFIPTIPAPFPTEENTLEIVNKDEQEQQQQKQQQIFQNADSIFHSFKMSTRESFLYRKGIPVVNDQQLTTCNFYDWSSTFPQLQILLDNIDVIRAEAMSVHSWTPWPEDHFSEGGKADWTVFPFMHTFPAFDTSKMKWIESTCAHCPKTAALLRLIPDIRTALFSRLGPQTLVASHRGWADLANHVLRTHCCLHIPTGGECGLIVDEEERLHRQGEILVFDDSKYHRAYNRTGEERVVLIVDISRPAHIPLGSATGGHTAELDKFIDLFK